MGSMMSAGVKGVFVAGVSEILGKRTNISAIDLNLKAGLAALDDAGIQGKDVDGIFTGRPMGSHGAFSSTVGERIGADYFNVAHTIDVGGASPTVMVHHAAEAVRSGTCRAVLVIYADNRLTKMSNRSVERLSKETHSVFETPLGPTIASMYALLARRYLFEHRLEDTAFARIAVNAAKNASITPGALRGAPVSVEDVMASRMISSPLRLLDCCLISDFAGALVVTSQDLAHETRANKVRILGSGEGHTHDHLVSARDPLVTGARLSSRRAFDQAELSPDDIRSAQIYDCFTAAVAIEVEEVGLAEHGTGAEFAGRPTIPLNTNGGMLAFQNGGIYHLTEAVTQLRGEAGDRQIPDRGPALVHGTGGILSHHGTVILGA